MLTTFGNPSTFRIDWRKEEAAAVWSPGDGFNIFASRQIVIRRGTQRWYATRISPRFATVVKPGDAFVKEPEMAGRTYPSFWLYKDNRGEYRWTYEASNGETIAVSSEGYKKRSDCENGINIMKASYNSPVWYPLGLDNAA